MSLTYAGMSSVEEKLEEAALEHEFERVPSLSKALFWNGLLFAGVMEAAFLLFRVVHKL